MMWLLSLMLGGMLNSSSPVYSSYVSTSPDVSDTLELHLTDHNHLVVPGLLNGQDSLQLMFHTAVSGVSLTTAFLDSFAVRGFDQSDTVGSWGGEQLSRYGENQQLQLGLQRLPSLTMHESRYSGQGTDGKFGPDLFSPQIIEVDPAHGRLILHDTLPRLSEAWQALAIRKEGSLLFLSLSLEVAGKQIQHEFLLHSGYEGTLLLDDEFVGEQAEISSLPSFKESELKDSYGNVLITRKVRLPAVQLGDHRFSTVPVGFFEGALGRQRISVFGADLIKRFHWVLDLEEEQVWIRTNELSGLPFSEV